MTLGASFTSSQINGELRRAGTQFFTADDDAVRRLANAPLGSGSGYAASNFPGKDGGAQNIYVGKNVGSLTTIGFTNVSGPNNTGAIDPPGTLKGLPVNSIYVQYNPSLGSYSFVVGVTGIVAQNFWRQIAIYDDNNSGGPWWVLDSNSASSFNATLGVSSWVWSSISGAQFNLWDARAFTNRFPRLFS